MQRKDIIKRFLRADVPVKCIIPLSQMVGGDEEDSRLLRIMADGAENYLRCFKWCTGIREAFFGYGYGGIVAVFLFRIERGSPDVDEWLWVVFGDVPPAYLVTDECKTPSEALTRYIGEMSKWVALAKEGRSSVEVIPVHVPSTPENADDLAKRLTFFREIVVPVFREAETMRA
jgi:hypothetical protein